MYVYVCVCLRVSLCVHVLPLYFRFINQHQLLTATAALRVMIPAFALPIVVLTFLSRVSSLVSFSYYFLKRCRYIQYLQSLVKTY